MVLFIRPNSFVPCTTTAATGTNHFVDQDNQIRPSLQLANTPSLLDFMKSKLVLMVSQELSLSGSFFSLYFLLPRCLITTARVHQLVPHLVLLLSLFGSQIRSLQNLTKSFTVWRRSRLEKEKKETFWVFY
ncbi:hypothetical protein PIB30_021382 [Stylosanthes scabra]|uniref:Uncharacterized protein n=1 Tax=Stylosanthes scabra TaxID=79078 RepID=A0ABU6S9J6_9FABA|nr:hypothetical protein [Stylosanthes scabra]